MFSLIKANFFGKQPFQHNFAINYAAFIIGPTHLHNHFKGVGNLVRADLCLDFLRRTNLLNLFKMKLSIVFTNTYTVNDLNE